MASPRLSPQSDGADSEPDGALPRGAPPRGDRDALSKLFAAAAADPLSLGAAGALLAFAAGWLRLSLLWVAAAVALVASVRRRARQRAAALADAAPPPFLAGAQPDAPAIADDEDDGTGAGLSSQQRLPEWLAYSDVERCAWVNTLADAAYAAGGRALLEGRLTRALCTSLAAHTVPIPGLPLSLVARVEAVSLGERNPLEVVAVKAVRPPPSAALAPGTGSTSGSSGAAGVGGELHLDVSWRLTTTAGANVTVVVQLSRRGNEGGDGACPADVGRGAAARGARRVLAGPSDGDGGAGPASDASEGGGLTRAVVDALLAAPSLTFVVRNFTASGQLRLAATPLEMGVPPFAGSLRVSLLRLPVVDFDLDAPQPLNVMALPPVASALTSFLKVRRPRTTAAPQQRDWGSSSGKVR
jgi:hypothetical protein